MHVRTRKSGKETQEARLMAKRFSILIPVRINWQADYNAAGDLVCIVNYDTYLDIYGLPGQMLPAGFRSDGMSVPRFFWRWLTPKIEGHSISPGIVHDWLYTSHVLTRKEADQWLKEALIKNGMAWHKAAAIYIAVRLFGASHWE